MEIYEQTIETTEQALKNIPKQTVTFTNGITLQRTIDGDYIYQGDILLNEEQVELLQTTGSLYSNKNNIQTKAGVIWYPAQKWKKNTVYYVIDDNMTPTTKQYVQQAVAHWQEKTNLKFIMGVNINGWIIFYNGDGCHSKLGRQGGGQKLSIDAGWGDTGNAIHEIGHAIGLVHEHCISCRDNFINVNMNNIKKEWQDQYKKNNDVINTDAIDFNSVMLYNSMAGSDIAVNPNIPVMTKKDGSTWVAQRNGLSPTDIAFVNEWYK